MPAVAALNEFARVLSLPPRPRPPVVILGALALR
jgi:hypothetical protein